MADLVGFAGVDAHILVVALVELVECDLRAWCLCVLPDATVGWIEREWIG